MASGRVLSLLAVALLAAVYSCDALVNPLRPNFESPKPRAPRDNRHSPQWSGKCPTDRIPRAVSGIFGVFYYKDSAASQIDMAKRLADLRAKRPLNAMQGGLANFAAAYWGSRPRNPAPAQCALVWLKRWATANALMGEYNNQGRTTVKFLFSSIALSWARMRDDPDLNQEDRRLVEDWMQRVNHKMVYADYAVGRLANATTNHLYVAGLSCAAVAIATDNQTLWDWATTKPIEVFRRQEMRRKTGYLPMELSRRDNSIMYHGLSAGSITMIAYLARPNGIEILDDSLRRLNGKIIKNFWKPDTIFNENPNLPLNRQDPSLRETCPVKPQACDRDYSCPTFSYQSCEVAFLQVYLYLLTPGTDDYKLAKEVAMFTRPSARQTIGLYTTYFFPVPQ